MNEFKKENIKDILKILDPDLKKTVNPQDQNETVFYACVDHQPENIKEITTTLLNEINAIPEDDATALNNLFISASWRQNLTTLFLLYEGQKDNLNFYHYLKILGEKSRLPLSHHNNGPFLTYINGTQKSPMVEKALKGLNDKIFSDILDHNLQKKSYYVRADFRDFDNADLNLSIKPLDYSKLSLNHLFNIPSKIRDAAKNIHPITKDPKYLENDSYQRFINSLIYDSYGLDFPLKSQAESIKEVAISIGTPWTNNGIKEYPHRLDHDIDTINYKDNVISDLFFECSKDNNFPNISALPSNHPLVEKRDQINYNENDIISIIDDGIAFSYGMYYTFITNNDCKIFWNNINDLLKNKRKTTALSDKFHQQNINSLKQHLNIFSEENQNKILEILGSNNFIDPMFVDEEIDEDLDEFFVENNYTLWIKKTTDDLISLNFFLADHDLEYQLAKQTKQYFDIMANASYLFELSSNNKDINCLKNYLMTTKQIINDIHSAPYFNNNPKPIVLFKTDKKDIITDQKEKDKINTFATAKKSISTTTWLKNEFPETLTLPRKEP